MNKTLLFSCGFATGAALTLWRKLHRQGADLAAARSALRVAVRRSAHQTAQIAQLEGEQELALAKLVQLSHALLNATAQCKVLAASEHTARIPTAMRLWLN